MDKNEVAEKTFGGKWRALVQGKVKKGQGQRYDIFGNGFVAGDVPGKYVDAVCHLPEFVETLKEAAKLIRCCTGCTLSGMEEATICRRIEKAIEIGGKINGL